MNKFVYSIAAGITAAMLIAGPALAAPARHAALDQYGCRWSAKSGDYRCYRGTMAGMHFASQEQMLASMTNDDHRWVSTQTRHGERLVPVYVDDDGAPRPMPPHASRGVELPPVSEDPTIIPVW